VDLLQLKLLLIVFILHLVIFARIALRTRRGYHRFLVLTFISLITMTGLRLWAPKISLGPVPVWHLFRFCAWACTLLAAVLWLRYRRFLKLKL
jgi:hypothetical protein